MRSWCTCRSTDYPSWQCSCSLRAVPTLRSGATKATTKTVNNALDTVDEMKEPHRTTTVKVPLSVSSEEPVVAAQTDQDVGEEHFQHDKPVRLSTTLIVALSVTFAFVVVVMVPIIMLVTFLHQRKQRRWGNKARTLSVCCGHFIAVRINVFFSFHACTKICFLC